MSTANIEAQAVVRAEPPIPRRAVVGLGALRSGEHHFFDGDYLAVLFAVGA